MAPTPQELLEQARREIREVTPDDARRRLEAGAVALDVREAEEVAAGHLPDATHIPRGLLELQLGDHERLRDPDTPIVTYCRAGGRSALAAKSLQDMGYRNVVSLAGGYDAWRQAGNAVRMPGEGTDDDE